MGNLISPNKCKPGPKHKSKNGICKICGSVVNDENYNLALGSNFCSWKCYDHYRTISNNVNCKCLVCGKSMYIPPSRLRRVKYGVVCSPECKTILKSRIMSGCGNHQYGLKGEKNMSFKGELILNQYGYVMRYLPHHPKSDVYGRYREHRYIIETQGIYGNEYFDVIDGVKILKDEYHVHHKDGNKMNNDISNLMIVTKSEHTTIHNKEKVIIRNETNGRIIGVFKRGELLGNPEEDNQQPSNGSNVIEGSTTNSRIRTDNAEDSNADTSALQLNNLVDDIVWTAHITLNKSAESQDKELVS